MQFLLCYGRGLSQDFVTRSDNINDVIYYLRVERDFEILKLTSFVTTNLIHFEKRAVASFAPVQVPLESDIDEIPDVDSRD